MADGKVCLVSISELVSSDSTGSPEFIQQLLPSAERTALLYHLSYLCLGGFPNLERLIRKRAVETQLLFGSSEALLMKCAGTSNNLVKSLLPSLKLAAEKNKPQFARKFLERAKEWIDSIVMDVKEIVKKYDEHNSDVAATTSDFNTEKEEAKKKQQQQTSEMKELQKIIDDLEAQHANISKEIQDSEKKIEEKNSEIHELINETQTNTDVAIFSMIVPFLESIISFIYKMKYTSMKDELRALHDDLTKTTEAQKRLKEEECDIQNKLMDNQLNLAKLKIENDQVLSIIHLDEVQKCLSRIQQILIQLQKFWEKVGSLLDTLKEKTSARDVWIDMKEEFLQSIDAAKEEWTKFGINCMNANKIFSIQANDAYRFLEVSPSSLSEEERMKEYQSVKEKLEKIRPNTVNPAAITL
ncbi:paramyosin-like isoform X1 [Megalobrama amblycephala]|uniref:paramyosin-like isoform X1 n=1 Tax=Megalobrama amblycephala TaxID=75352 RepID=UPI0020147F25|nr:paramyosin-like isoform X1 [Megalobrama amblycephala]